MATLFARCEAKTRIRQRDWLKLTGEKIRREQVGSVPTFLSVRANNVAKWKIGLKRSVRYVFILPQLYHKIFVIDDINMTLVSFFQSPCKHAFCLACAEKASGKCPRYISLFMLFFFLTINSEL